MSINHQYVEFSDQVIKRYVKTVPHSVSGKRVNPRTNEQVGFLLTTPPKNIAVDASDRLRIKAARTNIEYVEEVLELYSPQEVKLFERINKPLFEAGKLKEFDGENPEEIAENTLTDLEVYKIASTRNGKTLADKVNKFTSVITLQRILEAAKEADQTVKNVVIIEGRINELNKRSDTSAS